jgi:DNA-3-methyladenine glycosylase I
MPVAVPTQPAQLPAGLSASADGTQRCAWCQASPQYQHYHDHEWGFPVTDERRLFEKICLEGFQAGLSWLTILNKREAFRAGFAQFDAEQVAQFGEADITRLLADSGIVRHRGKIASTINNAQRVLELRREFGSFAAYVWRFEPSARQRPARITHDIVRAMPSTPESTALSKDLKKRGWSFVGPTTMYAFMQAMGLVCDHLEGCATREAALAARQQLQVPR